VTFHLVTTMPPPSVPELYPPPFAVDGATEHDQNGPREEQQSKLKVLQCPNCDACANSNVFYYLQALSHQVLIHQDVSYEIGSKATMCDSQADWLVWSGNQPCLCPFCSICMHEL
jgi:hypothetical protein